MNPPNIITGTCETCGQLEHVEGNLLVCKYCQIEALTEENKRLQAENLTYFKEASRLMLLAHEYKTKSVESGGG